MDRILGAIIFRKGVYSEVENDASFITTQSMVGSLARWGAAAVGGLMG